MINGTFPHPDCTGPYDAIFLTDLIEHIENPASLVHSLPAALNPDGIVVVSTPNVSALMAKIMGHKWWHFRIAHIGYYNKRTLTRLMESAGFTLVRYTTSRWYFSGDYIVQRLATYLPFLSKYDKYFKNIMLPFNIGDSMVGIFKLSR
jgi:SAM-dependent methyltransferase